MKVEVKSRILLVVNDKKVEFSLTK